MIDMDRLTREVAKARERDNDAFTYIFENTKDYTYSIAFSLINNYTEAQDIVQETYLKVYLSLSGLQDDRSFLRWLHTITFNICQDHLREHAKQNAAIAAYTEEQHDSLTAFDLDDWMQKSWNRELIRDMIAVLPEEQQQVIYLYYYKNHSVGEIAVIQNVSQNTVKSRLFYARNTLQKLIEAEEARTGRMHLSPAVTIFSAMLMLPEVGISLPQADAVRILAAVFAAAGSAEQMNLIGVEIPAEDEGSAEADEKQDSRQAASKAAGKPKPSFLRKRWYLHLRGTGVISLAVLLAVSALGFAALGYRAAQMQTDDTLSAGYSDGRSNDDRNDGIRSAETDSAANSISADSAALDDSRTDSDSPAQDASDADVRLSAAPSVVIAEGNCGENAYFTLTEDGVMTISGTGMVGYRYTWDCTAVNQGEDFSIFTEENLSPYRDRIKEIIVEDGITAIGHCALMHGSFQHISLPDSVTVIEAAAFAYCDKLEEFVFPPSVTYAADHVLVCASSLKRLVLGEKMQTIYSNCFYECTNLTDVEFLCTEPLTIYTAFSFCYSLKEIAFPDSLVYLETEAFLCSGLETVDLSNTNVTFGGSPFSDSPNLHEIILPDSMTAIPDHAFCNLPALTSVVFGGQLQKIGSQILENTCVVSIEIPESVVYIAPDAFYNARNLSAIFVNDKNQIYSSENGILYNKSKTRLLRYPPGKMETSFYTPDFVQEIGEYAFTGNKTLENLYIGRNVSLISSYALDTSDTVSDIYFAGGVPTFWGANAIKKKFVTLHFTEGTSGWTKGEWEAPDGMIYQTVMEN
ncbi:MAG: sigma-70 family RNA polymerase sigma factor [Clostridia bacterium]|nr:sigma-70 family RNA polymerase sigma factor [Clostridia bacterium]